MFKKLLLAFALGLLVVSIVVQKDATFKRVFKEQFREAFEKAYDCQLSCTLEDINLLSGSVVIRDMRVRSKHNNQWSWSCKRYHMGCSWLHFLLYRALELHIAIDNLAMKSAMHNGVVAIGPHVKKLLMIPDLPVAVVLKSLSIRDAQSVLHDDAMQAHWTLGWRAESRQIDKVFKTNVYFIDGAGVVAGKVMYRQPHGTLHVDIIGTASNFSTKLKANCSFVFPYAGNDETCYVTGSWSKDRGRFTVQNASKSILVNPLIIRQEHEGFITEARARFPFSCIQEMLGVLVPACEGTCTARARYEWCNGYLHGHSKVVIDDLCFGVQQLLETALVSCTVDGDDWHGKIYMRRLPAAELSGSWSWDQDMGCGNLCLANETPLQYKNASYWFINPNDFKLAVVMEQTGRITGTYSGDIAHTKLALSHALRGEFVWQEGSMHFNGSCDDDTYELNSANGGMFVYKDKEGTPLLSYTTDEHDNTKFHAAVTFPFAKMVVAQLTGYELQGQGSFEVAGKKEHDTYLLQAQLADAHVRLPQTYNFVHDAHAQIVIDMHKRIVTINDLVCDLHRGSIASPRIVCRFDTYGRPIFVHAPCVLNSCLLNKERDLFTIISGSLLLSKDINASPSLEGVVMLERSHLKQNIFDESFQHHLFTFDADSLTAFEQPLSLDLKIQTKHPIQIKTSFLETSAKVNLAIKHDRKKPSVSGDIELLGGSIAFPYTSLHIAKGTISFVPQQWHDPLIELIAKNNIRKHVVTMRATGSLKQHHIAFESTSSLTQEQIIALLLAGSEEGSLDVVMPALIMQNVKSMIFGPEETASTVTSYFKKILEPFVKKIHLVPGFSDQTGRGGLRGAMEIDVTDRLHARIQKNFSLSEDTKFEVEYQLSDDMSLKGTRDERGDVSGEVEMRWKF